MCAGILGAGERLARLTVLAWTSVLLKMAEKSKYVRLRASILACIKMRGLKSATGGIMNGVHGACGGFLLFGVYGAALGIVHIPTFPPFWMGVVARKAAVVPAFDFLCKRASLLFIYGVFKLAAPGLRRVAATLRAHCAQGAMDAARLPTRLCYHFGQCVDGEGLVRCAGFKREEVMGCKPLHLGKG